MTMPSLTLRPCPFCGGTALRFRHRNVVNGERTYAAGQMVCKCGAAGPVVKSPEFDRRNERVSRSGLEWMQQEALRKWNATAPADETFRLSAE